MPQRLRQREEGHDEDDGEGHPHRSRKRDAPVQRLHCASLVIRLLDVQQIICLNLGADFVTLKRPVFVRQRDPHSRDCKLDIELENHELSEGYANIPNKPAHERKAERNDERIELSVVAAGIEDERTPFESRILGKTAGKEVLAPESHLLWLWCIGHGGIPPACLPIGTYTRIHRDCGK